MDLSDLLAQLESLRDEAIGAVAAAADVAALDRIDVEVLGKKGSLTGVLRGIGALPPGDRPRVGAVANTVREALEAALGARRRALAAEALDARLAAEAIDVTTPARPIARGTLHPVNETISAMREWNVTNDGVYVVTYQASSIASTDTVRAYLPNAATTPEATVTVTSR